jgi:autotransporter-associated beta strand protein
LNFNYKFFGYKHIYKPLTTMRIFLLSLFSFLCSFAATSQTYTTGVANWNNAWVQSAGVFDIPNGIGLFSHSSGTNDGVTETRLITIDGTKDGTARSLNPGQKLILRMAGQDGGGRTGINTGGRIGFSLRTSSNPYFDGGTAGVFNRYDASSILRVEYIGGNSNASYTSASGSIIATMPNFATFKSGVTYEVEVISNKEFNLVIGGVRRNIQSFANGGGIINQIAITNISSNMDALFTNLAVANTPISLSAGSAENVLVTGVISDNGSTSNTVIKSGGGVVTLTAQNTYTGLTTVSFGTLRLNAPSANTISAGNDVSVSSGATLHISQDQVISNLTLSPSAILIVDAGKTLTITGNYSAGFNSQITNNGTIKLSGTINQTFPGFSAVVNAMHNLIINNPAGVGVNKAFTVSNALTFEPNNGVRSLLGTIAQFPITVNNVVGASQANGWIAGSQVQSIAPGTSARTYHIGAEDFYRPVTVTTHNVTTGGFIMVSSSTGGNHPQISSSGINPAKSISRYWTLTNNGVVFDNLGATFNFIGSDINGTAANYIVKRYDGTNWYNTNTTQRNQLSISATDFAGFGDFVVGEPCSPTIITTNPVGANYCQGATATGLSVAATGTSLSYQWYSNTSNSTTDGEAISGATSENFTPATTAPGTTYYYAIVTGACGTEISATATITVNEPAAITSISADAEPYLF